MSLLTEFEEIGGDAADQVFLRPEVKMEPLADGWYVWPHLVPPLQRAMNIAFRQLPLLRSFVHNPSIHIAAAKDPSLFGGPFLDLPRGCVDEAKRLVDRTTTARVRLIELAQAVKRLDEQLQEGARGFSLSAFYEQLPSALSGLLEFCYDINCHPKLRFYEDLIYDEYFAEDSYEIMLSLHEESARKFFMSTPRLSSNDVFSFQMPLTDKRIDLLSAMRTTAGSFEDVASALNVPRDQRSTFRGLFSTHAPSRGRCTYLGGGVRIRYFGHACVLLQTSEISILIDPMFAWDLGDNDGRFTFTDLPDRIDYVVLSHGHHDHCSVEMLLQLRSRIGCVVLPSNNSGSIADPSLKLILKRLGFRNLIATNAFEEIAFNGGAIVSLPFSGEHVDLDIHSRQGILVRIKGHQFVFLVDSDGCDAALFDRIFRRIENKVDALFIGMECHGAPLTWLYGPLLTKPLSRNDDESRRLSGLDSRRAWQAINSISAKKVLVYAMGQEPWLPYTMGLRYSPDSIQLTEVAKFLAQCRGAGVDAENLYLSKEWEY